MEIDLIAFIQDMDLDLAAVLVAVVTGLVEVAKYLGLPKKIAPAVALVLGIIGGLIYIDPVNIANGVLWGLVIGLAATGLYDRFHEDIIPKLKKGAFLYISKFAV